MNADLLAKASPKVARGLSALHTGWRNTRQLAEVCGRANGNAAARECRNAAARLGLIWIEYWVNEDETGPGSDHKLFFVKEKHTDHVPAHGALSDDQLRAARYTGYGGYDHVGEAQDVGRRKARRCDSGSATRPKEEAQGRLM